MRKEKTESQEIWDRCTDRLKQLGDSLLGPTGARDRRERAEGRRRGQIVIRTLLEETDLDPRLSVIKILDIPERDLTGPNLGREVRR